MSPHADHGKSCYKPPMHSATQTGAGSSATGQPQKLSLIDVRAIYDLPLPELVRRAMTVHQAHHDPSEVQLCSLLSVKTGGCQEDCGYCPQSAAHGSMEPEAMLSVDDVVDKARLAKTAGATRFCMGAAWRSVKDGPAFERVLDMVRGVRGLGMEACVTLGMLTDEQARKLAEAGLTAYNHNLDTSRSFYGKVITTRTYDDRLETLQRVRRAGVSLCCGGIIGMGESLEDRCALLYTLASLDPPPESVPVNALVAVPGTPLESRPKVDPLELVRTIATARILMPKSRVRLSAGRTELSRESQLLCFLVGANSIFYGEKLLTTGNPDCSEDQAMLREAGLHPSSAGAASP